MSKKNIYNRILILVLLVIVFFSYIAQTTFGKYVLTKTGRSTTFLLSGNGFTEIFAVTNAILTDSEGDLKNSVTSGSLHGIDGVEYVDGILTVPNNANTAENSLSSTENLSFVIKNASDYDLVACFDVIICMGWISDGELTCTIVAPSDSATSTDKAALVVTASMNKSGQNSDITLKHHKENDDTEWDKRLGIAGTDDPTIDVEYSNFGFADYSAYSFQLDPYSFIGDDIAGDGDNRITDEEFKSFILIPAGATKTFEFSISAKEGTGAEIARNAYASITMTAKRYPYPTT